ncbi:MAG: hypothetical protein OXE87_06010 [Chloroflexi bacterium]|nr:hypothetical protein [Chloroflexota bacterium]
MEWDGFLPVLSVIAAVLIAVVGWIVNDHANRKTQERIWKEERYNSLLSSTEGFYQGADAHQATALKNEFIRQLQLCWLYCPDKVINKGYAFLATVETGAQSTQEEKQRALGEFALEIRNDLLGNGFLVWKQTRLTWSDFQHRRSS